MNDTTMRSLKIFAACLALAWPGTAHAEWLLFDMGTSDSLLWPGGRRVTTAERSSGPEGFGWRDGEGLRAVAKAYREPVENRSRGVLEPPPIWTNAITEDAVVGERPDTFECRVAPGDYEIYVVCGISDPRWRSRKFDFEIRIGTQRRRVAIEGCHEFRVLRLHAPAPDGRLAIAIEPRGAWVLNALLVWDAPDAARVERDIIRPFEQWTFHLPPAEAAKWTQDSEPDPGPRFQPSPEEQRRGFALFTRHYLECVYPHTRPRQGETDPTLRLFAAPGEYEPLNFVVHPLRDLGPGEVTVESVGPVPAEAIDVRRVRFMRARPNYTAQGRYRVVPDVLEHFDEIDLRAGANERVWVTLRVPDDAAPGLYCGAIAFSCAGVQTTIPVQLRILPIALREDPTKLYGIYYHHPYDRMFEATDDVSREHFRRRALLEHRDMLAHGTRNVVLSVSCKPADASGAFDIRWEPLGAKLALWRECGFTGPVVMGISTFSVYEKHMKSRPGSHLRGVEDPPEAFCRELTAMVSAIEAGRKARNWPEFLYYPVDEPGTDPVSVAFMLKTLRACKAAGVRTYLTADPTRAAFAPLRPHVDVWCTQPFAPDRETVLADSKARSVEYWCYPNHVNGENDHTPVAGARMTYGFGFWRSGFRTLIPWIYSSSTGDPFNYLDGRSMDFFNRNEPDGTPIPVTLWEAYREGYDDARYIHTLETWIEQARRHPAPKARAAAETASRELQALWDAIRVQEKYKYDGLWAPEEFDVRRWIVARRILALQDELQAAPAKERADSDPAGKRR